MANGPLPELPQVEQDVPHGWRPTQLRDVAACRGGYGFPPKEQGHPAGEFPFFKVSDMSLDGNWRVMEAANNYVDAAALQRLKAKRLEPGTVIFPKIGAAIATNKKRLLVKPALVDNNVMGVWPTGTDRLTSEFLYYWFLSIDLRTLSASGPLPSITQHSVLNSIIKLPPLDEQRVIGDVLERVQKAQEAAEQVIAGVREVKRSLMHHLFTRGVSLFSELDGLELTDAEMGPMPVGWRMATIEQVATVGSGGTPDRSRPEYWGGTIPWVKTGEINYRKITNTDEYITELGLSHSAARIVRKGSILMAMYGQGVTRGRVAILGIDAALNQACAAIEVNNLIDVHFLYHWLTYRYEYIRALAHGANQKNLNAGMVRQLKVPLPPMEEQQHIAGVLDAVDGKAWAESQRRQALAHTFDAVLHELVTGKRRVAVAVNG
jgi:type I restriction enzyme S subunit